MKNKGFTLIELLAVIVILAIIALIAVPIILNIIEDARNESNERSVELYGTAIKNAAAKYQLGKTNKNITGKYTSTNEGKTLTLETDPEVVLTVDYEGAAVECTTVEISANGQVSLADCEVSGKPVDNTYGDVEEDDKTEEGNEGTTTPTQPTRYYSRSTGYIGEDLPSEATTNASDLGKTHYFGLDVGSNNKVTAAYVCFTRNGTEYCLKGYDTEAYATNQAIMKEAFGDEGCGFGNNLFSCHAGGLSAEARSNGYVIVHADSADCGVYPDGDFWCVE